MMNPKTDLYFQNLLPSLKGKQVPWGIHYAYRAWQDSVENEASAFEVNELPWGSTVTEDMRAFVQTLRAAGVERFVVTNQSTALMNSLHVLASFGGVIEGVATVTRKPRYWGDEEHIGLAIRLSAEEVA